MDPYSYDLVTRQREALQASLDATAEVLLGEAFERVRAHLREQLSRRGLTMPEVEVGVDDLAIAISQGGQPVLGAGFVEEIRIHDPESFEYDHRVAPAWRRTWWQRLRREPPQHERYIFDGCPDHGDWRHGRDWQAMPRPRPSLSRRWGRTPSWKAFARRISAL